MGGSEGMWPEGDAHVEYLRTCEKRILDYDDGGNVGVRAQLDQELAEVREDLKAWKILVKPSTWGIQTDAGA